MLLNNAVNFFLGILQFGCCRGSGFRLTVFNRSGLLADAARPGFVRGHSGVNEDKFRIDTAMRDMKTFTIDTSERPAAAALSTLVLLVVLITSITGAAAPV